MTTLEDMAGFEVESRDGTDQTYYLVLKRMKGAGDHGGHTFYDLPGFWELSGDNHQDAFEVNRLYEMRLRLGKAKTGKNAASGSRYTDIMKSRLAKDTDIPQGSAPEAHSGAPRAQLETNYQGAGNGSDRPTPVQLGMCQNNAIALICAGIVTVDEEVETLMGCIQGLRDQLYCEVTALAYLEESFSIPVSAAPAPQEPAAEGPDNDLPF